VAKLKSSKKRIRSNERRRLRNLRVRASVRTEMKKIEQAVSEGKAQEAREYLSEVASQLDSAAVKGIIKKNYASRNKSRLAKKLNAV